MEGLVSAGLVGRERELERARWTLLGEGSDATALVLEGPAGIGKTSVWRAAVAEARGRGIRVLQARASEGEHELDFVGLADWSSRFGPRWRQRRTSLPTRPAPASALALRSTAQAVAVLLPSALVTTIPQKELRNNIGEVLRRAEAGEEITITVAGREVARLGPTGRRQWVGGSPLQAVWRTPAPDTLITDLERFPATITDPFA